eukprot:Tamp_37451.p1 GENE.Tamp_37451~~Tamp_37451.p1  ORF type:complete len:133 (+),score=14.53 Tamp_37451:1-399(+)
MYRMVVCVHMCRYTHVCMHAYMHAYARVYSFFFHEQGDILEADIREATVVWCANLCMSPEFDRLLALKLAQQPKLRAVASLKDWPEGIAGFAFAGTDHFEMSWTKEIGDKGGLVYMYTRATPSRDSTLPPLP